MLVNCEKCPCYNYDRDYCQVADKDIKMVEIANRWLPTSDFCPLVKIVTNTFEFSPVVLQRKD